MAVLLVITAAIVAVAFAAASIAWAAVILGLIKRIPEADLDCRTAGRSARTGDGSPSNP
jgi:hypothetical protein